MTARAEVPDHAGEPDTGPFTASQAGALNLPINPVRVLTREGNRHLEAWDVRRYLIKLFGYGGWSGEVVHSELLYEERWQLPAGTKDGAPVPGPWRVSVGYRVRYQLSVYAWRKERKFLGIPLGMPRRVEVAVYTEEATGGASNFPDSKRADAHDFAVKTAESQAMKRAAMNLGDQFGLSLYSKTPANSVVQAVLVGMGTQAPDAAKPKGLDEGIDAVTPEETMEVPEGELDWVSAAEGTKGDTDSFDTLYNQARAKKVAPVTLRQMRAVAGQEAQS